MNTYLVKEYGQLYTVISHKLTTTWDALAKLSDYELNQIFNPLEEQLPTDRLQELHASPRNYQFIT